MRNANRQGRFTDLTRILEIQMISNWYKTGRLLSKDRFESMHRNNRDWRFDRGQVRGGDNLFGTTRPRCDFSSRFLDHCSSSNQYQVRRKKFHSSDPRYPYSAGECNVWSLCDKVSHRCQYQMSKLPTIFWVIPSATRWPSTPPSVSSLRSAAFSQFHLDYFVPFSAESLPPLFRKWFVKWSQVDKTFFLAIDSRPRETEREEERERREARFQLGIASKFCPRLIGKQSETSENRW